MTDNRCTANTASGTQCSLAAGPSGLCHIHDPKRIAERASARAAAEEAWRQSWPKGERLREVIEVITSVCGAKGWDSSVTSQDYDNWRYATVSVGRYAGREPTEGIFDITVNGGARLTNHKTTFHGYGLAELQDAIMTELRKLPWMEPARKNTQGEVSQTRIPAAIQQIERLISRFPIAARQLLRRHSNRPTLNVQDEHDMRDLFHVLLTILFDDIRPEEYSPSYAGGCSRIDFLLKAERMVVELKMASESLKDKEIGEQLIVDIERYQIHPDCRTLVCFVYDPGHQLHNAIGLERDLSQRRGNLEVRVLVLPR